jgi:hypothetical protein
MPMAAMTDEELIKRLLDWSESDEGKINDTREVAADRIEALVKERDALIEWNGQASVRAESANDRAERLEAALKWQAEQPEAHPFMVSQARAAIAQAPAPVRVKPLVWEEKNGAWDARTAFGTGYTVADSQWTYGPTKVWFYSDGGNEAAKAAAQADYEARILSAITPAPSDDAVKAREAALKEAAAVADSLHYPDETKISASIRDAILALIAKQTAPGRSANRVTYDDKGNLDEIVTDAGVHLEDLGGNRWFLGASRSDGTEIRVWFNGKVTMVEDDAKEART